MPTDSMVLLMICAFTFVPLFLAEIARKKSLPTCVDFFLQGRTMNAFFMYATVFATWMSAFAFLGAISYFYEQGPIYMTTIGWDALFSVLFYIIGRRIWFYGKTYNFTTPTDFFNNIYRSRTLNLMVTAISLIFTMIYLQIQLIAGLYLIQTATGWKMSWQVSGAIFFAVLIIYLWAGGLRAVALADMFYGGLVIITIMAVGFFLINVAGGVEEVFSKVIADDIGNVVLAGHGEGNQRVWLWLCLFIVVPVGAFMGPQMWIRNYAAKSQKNFEILPFLLTLSSIISIGTLFAGSAGVVLYMGGGETDTLVATLLLKYANPIFCTFIFLGIAAAVLSTANSQIHAISAIYSIDIHKRYINKRIPDRSLVGVAKWTVIAISAFAYLILLVIPQSIFSMAVIALGGTSQLIVPVCGALFWGRSNAGAAIAGLAAGLGLFITITAATGIDESIGAVAGLFLNACVFVIMSIVLKIDPVVHERITTGKKAFCKKLKRT